MPEWVYSGKRHTRGPNWNGVKSCPNPSSLTVTESQFADDAAAVAIGTTRESMERAAQALEEVTSKWGLIVSKTKLLVVGVYCEETDLQPIYIRGHH